MKHATKLKNEKKIIKSITTLRYDALGEFIRNLSVQFMEDAIADTKRGRLKLAKCLSKASENIFDAWFICEKYMNKI